MSEGTMSKVHAADWLDEHAKYKRSFAAGLLRRKLERVKGECTWCAGPLSGRQRCWCSLTCLDAYLDRCHPPRLSWSVRKRDKGICSECGVDTVARDARVDRIYNKARNHRSQFKHQESRVWSWMQRIRRHYGNHPFEIDHIVPVIEGGGCCTIDNLRTLCIPCHRVATKQLAARRAAERKDKRRTLLAESEAT